MVKNQKLKSPTKKPKDAKDRKDEEKKIIVTKKTLSKNEDNKKWENTEKNKIKDLLEKKFENLSPDKKIRFIQNATVLHKNEKFYENTCQGI